MNILKIGTILVIILLLTAGLYGFEWQTFTNGNQISGITEADGTYWASSSGGVLNFNPAAENIVKYVNTDGLGGIDIYTCAYGNSFFWFGSADGKLTRYNPDSREWKQFLFTDRDDTPLILNHLFSEGIYLWVSSNIGVSLFDTERYGGEIKETYRRFGDIPAGTSVNGSIVAGDLVWVATDRGVAYASRNDPNLLDYTHWISANTDNLESLPSDNFMGIFEFDNSVWGVLPNNIVEVAAGDSGLSLGEVISLSNTIYSFAASGDTIYIGCGGGNLFAWTEGDLVRLEAPTEIDSAITALYPDPDFGLLMGTLGEGIFFENNSQYINLRTSGPVSNLVRDLAATSDGKIWIEHRAGYLSVYDESGWSSVGLPISTLISLRSDSEDNIWAGSFGGGVVQYTPDQQMIVYGQENSSLIGNNDNLPGSLDYIVVPDMCFDINGVAWFACYRGHVKRPISFYDPDQDIWDYYTYTGFSQEAKITAIYSDGIYVWAGFEDAGLFRIYYGDDPFDQSDLEFKQYTRDSLLPSLNVEVITADSKGTIYVGTDMGLAEKAVDDRFFSSILLPEGIGPQITSIIFDQRGNLWVGTQTGLAYRPAGESEFADFTTSNSDLIGNEIAALTLDSERRLWVASDAGISVITYDAGTVAEDVDDVFAYPNPLIITDDGEKALFNYQGEARVDIFSLDGSRVNTVLSNVGWDGTNESGEKVAAGMYLFLITDSDGNTHTGKIAIIRK